MDFRCHYDTSYDEGQEDDHLFLDNNTIHVNDMNNYIDLDELRFPFSFLPSIPVDVSQETDFKFLLVLFL
jgi:hypothetical protein